MNAQIYEEAADWLVKQRAAQPADSHKRAFDAWLRRSPDHVRAYLDISSTWEEMDVLDKAGAAPAEELIALANAADNVVSLVSHNPPVRSRAPALLKLAAALAGVAVLIAAVFTYLPSHRNPIYATAIGEQRSLVLDDGSTVELNSKSRIRLRFTDRVRGIELLEGQALFRVARHSARPFIVTSGSTQVRAIGTEFDVYRKRTGIVVTVLEGKVEVADERARTRAAAGEQIVATHRALSKPTRPNLAAATSWTQRSLIFESAPLAEVAEEFNRYTTRPLIVEDAALAGLRVSGVFSSVDPRLLLKFLRAQAEVAVTETHSEILISSR